MAIYIIIYIYFSQVFCTTTVEGGGGGGETAMVLPLICSSNVGLIAGICRMKSQSSPYSSGEGGTWQQMPGA